MNNRDQWYLINETDRIDSPALVLYPDRMKENISILKSLINDPSRLRPHVKTHKTQEATLLMMAAGINKFKCATISEAEMLGMCKAADVLIAYPLSGPKLKRFIELIKNYPATFFSCLADNIDSAAIISDLAILNKTVINIYVDLNVGMNRTGIKPGEPAIHLFEECAQLGGINVMGFHAYDGHIRDKEMVARTQSCDNYFLQIDQMIESLNKKGFKNVAIVAGGSPTYPILAQKPNVECSPGTFIYWDKGYYDSIPEQEFLFAALVLTRVVSIVDETKLCLDLGYKAIASENALDSRVYFLNAPDFKMVSHSEEHLVVETNKGHPWKIGDVLYGLPIHICPTCALYERGSVIENGKISGTWDIIARDRSIGI
jgi:D-serine deaminase-like pyridoxal phosphate-dependent protein